ncbi:hypothetical protein BDV98DRAFT_559461 [Pterulicium gracile]|uniref:Uncharacterized protein n=1 Tax=Pterulicium gracile TaxID=1884261 RepID=A0A5C3QYP8_9AGAR|nr:hypothetical protein BDV98DRAFT_559461 [Pterula gracilis]
MRFFDFSTTFVLAGLSGLVAGAAVPESKGELDARQLRSDWRVYAHAYPMTWPEGNTDNGLPYGPVLYLCNHEQFTDCYDLHLLPDGNLCYSMSSAAVGLDNWVHSLEAYRSNVSCELFREPNCTPESFAMSVRGNVIWPRFPTTQPKIADNISSLKCRLV